MTAWMLAIMLSTVMKMDELKSETVKCPTPEASISSAQTRRGRKRSSNTSQHCKTRRRGSQSNLSCSLANNNSAILESDDNFGQFVASKLKLIDNVRAKQFAKLQIHSILFNAQFDVTSTPPDVIRSLVAHHQSLNSGVLSSALNSQYSDSNST